LDLDYLLQQQLVSRFLSRNAPTDEGRKRHRALARNYGARIARAKRAQAGRAGRE